MLTIHGAHHLKSNVDQLYLHRRLGVRGLYQLVMLLNVSKGLLQIIYTTLGTSYILQCARDVLQIQLVGTKDA